MLKNNKKSIVDPCLLCHGSGDDPSGWTLVEAQKEPKKFNKSNDSPNMYSLLSHVVSPLPFDENGILKCRACNGNGVLHA